jgi:hypothetical protein
MIAAALLIALVPEGIPVLPPGLRPEFHALALKVENAVAAKDWNRASELAKALPTRSLRVGVDLSAVSPERRPVYEDEIRAALNAWAKAVEGRAEIGMGNANVLIRFVPAERLGRAAKLDLTSGVPVLLEIATERGNPPRPVTGASVLQETLHALGAYFGIGDARTFGSAMGRSDLQLARAGSIIPYETALARASLNYAAAVREAISKKANHRPTRAGYALQVPKLAGGRVLQGEIVKATLPVENRGTAPLEIIVRPDCSCIRPVAPEPLGPGQKGAIEVLVDTTEFTGEFRHKILVWTNDPEALTSEIPVEVDIEPRVLVTTPNGSTALVEDRDAEVEFLIGLYGDSPARVTAADLEGFEGRVVIEELKEPGNAFEKPPSRAYRLRAILDAKEVRPGRSPGNIVVELTDPRFSPLRRPLYAQKGVSVIPGRVFFGELKGARDAQIQLTRSGKPFRILKVTTDTPHLSVRLESGPEGEGYRLWVTYDGKAGAGEFYGIVTLETDVPGQETIRIPVNGYRVGAQ